MLKEELVEVSPFLYQGPLPPQHVRGRDDLLDDLVARVTEHRVTALLGPRQFGKTSVLGRLAADLTEVATVAIDLFGVATYDDLVMRIADALTSAVPAAREPAFDVAVSAGIDLGLATAQLSMAPKKRPDARVLYSQLVRTVVEVARRTPLLVVFDEFQSINEVEGATAVLRTELQHHYRNIGLVFAGSAPSAMRTIFTRHDQPFFNQADLLTIGPLSMPAVHGIVNDGFHASGRDPGDVATLIFRLTGGHPQRTMRAADMVWRYAVTGSSADQSWRSALQALRNAEAPTLAATFSDLSGSEQKVLRLVANGHGLFGTDAAALQLSRGGAQYTRDALIADGKLHLDADGALTLIDPLLADWLRQRLPL
jgi:uncharacterized protein